MASKHNICCSNLYRNNYERALRQGAIGSNMTLDQYIDVQLAESDGDSDLSKESKAKPSETSASDTTYGIPNKPASFGEAVEDLQRLSEKLELSENPWILSETPEVSMRKGMLGGTTSRTSPSKPELISHGDTFGDRPAATMREATFVQMETPSASSSSTAKPSLTELEKLNINLGNAVETKLDPIAEFEKRSELLSTPVKFGMTEQEIRASQATVGQPVVDSKKETSPTPEIKPGMTELELRAIQYWGTLASNTDISPRCSAFVVALCDIACAISDAHSPAIPVSNIATYLMPEHFSLIMTMFGFEEPVFGPAQLVQHVGRNFFDSVFAQYYLAFQLPIFWTTRPGSRHQNRLPLITRAAVKTWLWDFLRAYPDDMHKRINKILNEMGDVLRDPISEELFEFKSVPRACVPAFFDKDFESFCAKGYAQYSAAADQLIANAKPEQTPESIMQREKLKMQINMNNNMLVLQGMENLAKIQKQGGLIMNGGWTKDEWGNDKYVESSIW